MGSKNPSLFQSQNPNIEKFSTSEPLTLGTFIGSDLGFRILQRGLSPPYPFSSTECLLCVRPCYRRLYKCSHIESSLLLCSFDR